jgi:hypothetical protein
MCYCNRNISRWNTSAHVEISWILSNKYCCREYSYCRLYTCWVKAFMVVHSFCWVCFLTVTPCEYGQFYRCFGGKCCLHRQGWSGYTKCICVLYIDFGPTDPRRKVEEWFILPCLSGHGTSPLILPSMCWLYQTLYDSPYSLRPRKYRQHVPPKRRKHLLVPIYEEQIPSGSKHDWVVMQPDETTINSYEILVQIYDLIKTWQASNLREILV